MRRLTGTGEHPEKLNAILFENLPSLHAARTEEDDRIIAFVQSLDEPDFEEMWDYRTLNGTPQRQRRRVAEPEPLDLLIMQRDKS
jgi:uncharacterized damage-inducible protein DinB